MWVQLIIILLLIWYFQDSIKAAVSTIYPLSEGYKSCMSCNDDYRMLDGGMVVVNPYVWPFSGTECISGLYKPAMAAKFDFKDRPMIHHTQPDHVILM